MPSSYKNFIPLGAKPPHCQLKIVERPVKAPFKPHLPKVRSIRLKLDALRLIRRSKAEMSSLSPNFGLLGNRINDQRWIYWRSMYPFACENQGLEFRSKSIRFSGLRSVLAGIALETPRNPVIWLLSTSFGGVLGVSVGFGRNQSDTLFFTLIYIDITYE